MQRTRFGMGFVFRRRHRRRCRSSHPMPPVCPIGVLYSVLCGLVGTAAAFATTSTYLSAVCDVLNVCVCAS